MANARRAEESLRVLEEFAKLPDLSSRLNWTNFKDDRFEIYDLEQRLVSKLLRRDRMERISGLYVILDTQALEGRDEVEVAHQAIRGGARVIQLRDKYRSRKELLGVAEGLRDLCARNQALFIVNDYLDLALAADADGLHVGQGDLPLPVVRRELPADRVVGCSTHNLEQALRAEAEGADYIAVGSIYPTPSKEDAKVVGLEVLRQIGQSVSLPLVAIGGINQDNVAEVIAAGATSVAVINAAVGVRDVEGAARKLTQEIAKASRKEKR
jgi:thiamine-phosphate pyrophosphorylase